MSEKKAIFLDAPAMSLAGAGDALAKFSKKAAVLVNADAAGLAAKCEALGGVKCQAADLAAALEKNDFCLVEGGEEALAQVLEAANRRTLVVAACAEGVAFYGMAVNGKAGKVERKVDADDVALTIATIANLPISADCTAGIIYQVLKDPNLKLTEITKLEEALARMEQVMARNSREPWEKHDCA